MASTEFEQVKKNIRDELSLNAEVLLEALPEGDFISVTDLLALLPNVQRLNALISLIRMSLIPQGWVLMKIRGENQFYCGRLRQAKQGIPYISSEQAQEKVRLVPHLTLEQQTFVREGYHRIHHYYPTEMNHVLRKLLGRKQQLLFDRFWLQVQQSGFGKSAIVPNSELWAVIGHPDKTSDSDLLSTHIHNLNVHFYRFRLPFMITNEPNVGYYIEYTQKS